MNLIVGNLFSFLAAVCIAISVIKKNKKDLIGWQIFDVIFCIISCVLLSAYAAATTNTVALVRNVLAYKNKLTKHNTLFLTGVCVMAGLLANNRGIIGLFPVMAAGSYTVLMYVTKDEQQMRWALISNLILWFVHDFYIQSYPLAVLDVGLSGWTAVQIFVNRKKEEGTAK